MKFDSAPGHVFSPRPAAASLRFADLAQPAFCLGEHLLGWN
ncbi:MAG: hypothetical protein ACT443_15340 [Gemmatimonadota bacterium]